MSLRVAGRAPQTKKIPRPKRDIAKDICSTLVGFANADGGSLLVGVEDDGRITGLSDLNENTISYLADCWKDGVHKDTPISTVQYNRTVLDGKTILSFTILKSTQFIHQTSDGKCLQRRDLETVPISAQEITFSRSERLSQEYDRIFIDSCTVADLDRESIQALADQISRGMSVEKCLQHLGLAEFVDGSLRIRRAAALLFAKDIVKWHPRVQIRILKISGTEVGVGTEYNATADDYVQGNIIQLIDQAWDQLRPHLVQTKFSGTAKFETRVLYPELACREALINAIAHRDYSQEGRGIEIYVFDDRMEVKSPGELLSTLSIVDIKAQTGAHQSRNTFISRVLRELGYMREVGEGMRRIFELMQSNELEEPSIQSGESIFGVILSNKTLYSAEHMVWLDSFSDFDLSREEKAIVVLGYGGKRISTNEIWSTLGIVDTDNYRKLINGLQRKGILKSEIEKQKAQKLAKLSKISVRDVPRLVIGNFSDEQKSRIRNNRSKNRLEGKKIPFIPLTHVEHNAINGAWKRNRPLHRLNFRSASFSPASRPMMPVSITSWPFALAGRVLSARHAARKAAITSWPSAAPMSAPLAAIT